MAYYFNKLKESATSSIQQIAKNYIAPQDEDDDDENIYVKDELNPIQTNDNSASNSAQDDFFNTFIPSI